MLVIDKKKIVSTVVMCDTFYRRLRGLMFRRRIVDEAYVFVFDRPQIIGLHMFWVFFPIDILWLDSEKNIVHIATRVLPFVPYVQSPVKAQYVIELPCRAVEKYSLRTGMKCEWNR